MGLNYKAYKLVQRLKPVQGFYRRCTGFAEDCTKEIRDNALIAPKGPCTQIDIRWP